MKSVAEVVQCWPPLEQIKDIDEFREHVKLKSHQGDNGATRFRSLEWKILLLFESIDQSTWTKLSQDSRTAYSSLREHFISRKKLQDEFECATDPLSDNVEDVERCMPENYYFRQPATQMMLVDILFIFAKLNPDVSYRQGMHEILAPVIWVIERSAIDPNTIKDGVRLEKDTSLMMDICDSYFIEHDSFTLFTLIMQNAKSLYESQNATVRGSRSSDSPMIIRCRRIFERMLPRTDPELAAHLQELEIQPQLFLLKWLRLLFGREFPFDNLLEIWSLVFATDPSLQILDYICLAMILSMRWDLLEADHNAALTQLLHYHGPRGNKPAGQPLVEDALCLRERLDRETGATIIEKRTGRKPGPIDDAGGRPRTPPSLNRNFLQNQSPLGARQFSGPRGVEALLQDAARGVVSQGERWGVNKAVRDAVGEMRKNVHNLQSGRGSPRRQLINVEGLSTSPTANEANGGLFQRITDLAERNKRLAESLSLAVNELWDLQKVVSESKSLPDESIACLSQAIGKAQVVQVYLEDSTIPLPPDLVPTDDEQGSPKDSPSHICGGDSQATKSDTFSESVAAEQSRVAHTPSKIPRNEADWTINSASKEEPKPPDDAIQTRENSSETANMDSVEPQNPSGRERSAETQAVSKSNSRTSFNEPRPSLTHSSFSWMLGQRPESADPVSASAQSSEFRRTRASATTSFLFGEETSDFVPASERKKGSARQTAGSTSELGHAEPEIFNMASLKDS